MRLAAGAGRDVASRRFWFLIAPIAVYLLAFGIVGAAYSRFEGESELEPPPAAPGAPLG